VHEQVHEEQHEEQHEERRDERREEAEQEAELLCNWLLPILDTSVIVAMVQELQRQVAEVYLYYLEDNEILEGLHEESLEELCDAEVHQHELRHGVRVEQDLDARELPQEREDFFKKSFNFCFK
jgi:hypothetical protein